jgi:hypothetical protein
VSDALQKGFRKLEAIEKEVGFCKKEGGFAALSLQIDEAKPPKKKKKPYGFRGVHSPWPLNR